ncbi:MAG TPA: DUF4198 domain-containing protein [Burkholderiaceae bacterium]|jgi:uncharacterized GH25 family protein
MRKQHLLIVAALAGLPFVAQAHVPWLLPNATMATGKEAVVSVDASLSEDLFIFERALKIERLSITGPGGLTLEAQNRSAARNHESFDVTLPKEGTYRISNFSRSVMGAYKLGGETKRFRGELGEVPAGAEITSLTVMRNRQETFVSREEAGETKFAPEGDGLELLPLGAVTDLSSGDSTRFKLLLDGKPLADAAVTVRKGGNRYRYKMGEITLKTDAQGEFTMQWAEPGQYWIGANAGERGGPGGMGGTREQPLQRAAVSATFEVLPK